ncbi:MAG: glycyl-radical enzyme activating protein [Bacillota bacterium]
MTPSGIVCNIQRYSIHDGPGIRTLVFLKGCPLKCIWCANPESQLARPEIVVTPKRCIGCGKCIVRCPEKAIISTPAGNTLDRNKCIACGFCVEECSAEGLQLMGQRLTVDEVVKEIEGDGIFYACSGGGVTLSGGEPFYQPEFTFSLLKAFKKQGLNTAVETCGHASFKLIEPCLPYLDLILYDIKHLDPDLHQKFTGVENALILSNARKLAAKGVKLVIRIPLVPGLNDSETNLIQTVEFAREIGIGEVHLLPYHEFGRQKYLQLGRECALDINPPGTERMEEIRRFLSGRGLIIQVGG